MRKKIIKNLIFGALLLGGAFLANYVFAQDFGINAVNDGLNNSLATGDPRTIAGRIINIALGFLGAIALGLVLYAGFLWMTSGGEEEKITKAKQYLKNGVIGLTIILASWAIATFIISQLGGTIGGGGGCVDGETQVCGCDGLMTCTDESWGPCVGSDCGGGPGPDSCDSTPLTQACDPEQQICAETDYCDDTCFCKPKGGPGDPCDKDPDAACNPDNNRCGQYLTCNPTTCLCFGPPVITEISPVGGFCAEDPNQACLSDNDCTTNCNQTAPNGAKDNFITIFGKNFGVYSATGSQVIFEGNNNPKNGVAPQTLNPNCIYSWRDDQIVIAIPDQASLGPIKVTTGDNLADTTNNNYGPTIPDFIPNEIARPGLCYLNPDRGVLSSKVVYQGIKLAASDAYFGNYQSNVRGLDSDFSTNLAGTSTIPNIRAGNSGSFVINNLKGNNQKSNYLKFIKDPEAGDGPYIISFTPKTGSAGQYVTINGSGFGAARGTNHVYFGTTEAAYDFPDVCLNSVWKDKQIVVKVPAGLPDGDSLIRINLGTTTIDTAKLNHSTFETDHNLALKSSLCKIDPDRGPIATPVDLWGEYFGLVGEEGLVKFNYEKKATGTIQKDGQADTINTAVPNDSLTGPVRVINDNGYGNELNFEIGSCTVKTDCEATEVCCPANTYKKGLCVNSIEACFINIPTSVFEWSFNTGFGNSTTTPPYDSCAGMAKYLGNCYQGAMCPNSPGACSSPATSYQKEVGSCDGSCQDISGCTATTCTYNDKIDRCVRDSCDLPQLVSLGTQTTQKVCNSEGRWEILSLGSCPSGWTRGTNNRCFENNSSCNLCSDQFTCKEIDSIGYCVSDKICADQEAKCLADKCVVEIKPSCECCCRIGHDQEDCCAGLKCTGRCGADLTSNGGVGTCCDSSGNCVNPNCSATGGIVAEVGGYCIHTFKNSGTLKVNSPLNATVLVIGGGGGAGGGQKDVVYDAGAGGGQVIEQSLLIPVGQQPVHIGNAGVSGTQNTNTDGGDSSFLTITAAGGKRAIYPGIGGISGSGKMGGARKYFGSGGGGGDSQNGFNAPTNEKGGDGGAGTYSNIFGTNIAYGGGGEGNSFVTAGIGGVGYKNPGGGGSGQTGAAGNEAQPGMVAIKYPAVPATSCPSGYSESTNTYGNCSGCAKVGTTAAEHDNACNCLGHTGQYCDISEEHSEGICVDCANITSKENCGDHSTTCCFDANQTEDSSDDFCRGVGSGKVISSNPSSSDYGYCGYYDCESVSSTPPGNPTLCASSTLLKLGYYDTVEKCTAGCLKNSGTDFCSLFDGQQNKCLAENACCFDQATSECLSGARINNGGSKDGFCAYYDCDVYNPKLCDFNATTTGRFISTSTCVFRCANDFGGAGLSCASKTSTSSCEISICTLPKFSCLTATGGSGVFPEDCGACCCQPGQNPDTCATTANPNLYCQADRGNCSGAGRGLCCGCQKDNDCGHINTVGCGSDTCCEARPQITTTTPPHLATNICRNAMIKVDFDQLMDITSFNTNALLLEERDYGNGVCPTGTFITKANDLEELVIAKNRTWLGNIYNHLETIFHDLAARFSGQAIANTPDPNKLYCAVPGTISNEVSGNATSLVFAPQRLLAPATNYYLIIRGDEDLDSQAGVLSLKEIGFNGEGYLDPSTNAYLEGEFIKFNKRAYKNSQIIKFTTLSDQGGQAGVCLIKQVGLDPAAYLFKTTSNDLNENDTNPDDRTFDTKADKDKVLIARAYSSSGQILQPITGYYWDFNFAINDSSVATISPITNLPFNKTFVKAQDGVTDSETKIAATVNMNRFSAPGCAVSPCTCQGTNCSNNCCNAYSVGDSYNQTADLYVFVCNNPWPPVDASGAWSPWEDNCQGSVVSSGACAEYNYKFYYCRDFGNSTTLDDLPAIIKQPVIRGQSETLVCSSDKNPCPLAAQPGVTKCGVDQNGDGYPDGLCIWNILKESYFFREAIPSAGQIIDAIDMLTGQEVKVEWEAPADQIYSYKIYYLKSGQGSMSVKEVKPTANNCTLVGNVNMCSTVIDGLTTGKTYVFKVTAVSINKTESQLSNEKTASSTDQTPPLAPINLQAQVASSSIKFNWGQIVNDQVVSDVLFYRLYHGLGSGQYGESFDSADHAVNLTFNKNQFISGNNYFALSAVDGYGNESNRSAEILVVIP